MVFVYVLEDKHNFHIEHFLSLTVKAGPPGHSPILAKSIPSKDGTRKSLIVQASPMYRVDHLF